MSTDTFPALRPRRPGAEAGDLPFPERAFARLGELELDRWHVLVALAAMVAVSLWLRTSGISMYYWVDEGISVGIASHPLAHIPSLLGQDGSPPLYYLVLHVWMSLFGRSEIATHELSLIFATLCIPAAYWAGSSLFDRGTGLICALLAAGTPYLNAYAQETRMYALLALLALITSAAFVHAFVRRNRRYIAVFVISMAACLYTHNWALFLALMAAAAFLVCVNDASPEDRPGLWRDGIIALIGVAILYAPWVPTLIYQARHTGAPWDVSPVIWSLTQGLYSIVGGRGSAVALLLAGGTGLWALRARGQAQERVLLAAKTLLILGFGTLLIAWLYSKLTPAWAVRYLAVIVGPLILVFGFGLARAGRLGLVALALVAAFWILGPARHSRDGKSNVGAVAAKVRHELGSDALVLSTQPEQVPDLAYYLPAVTHFGTPLGAVPDPRVDDWRNALERLEHSSVSRVLMPMVDRLKRGERLLLVIPTSLAKTPRYLDLVDKDSVLWTRALDHDRAFRRITVTEAGARASGLPVEASLYVKR